MVVLQDFSIGLALTFNASQANQSAQQSSQIFTDLQTRLGQVAGSVPILGQAFNQTSQQVGQASQQMGQLFNSAGQQIQGTSQQMKTSLDTTRQSVATFSAGLSTVGTNLGTTSQAFTATVNPITSTGNALSNNAKFLAEHNTQLTTNTTSMGTLGSTMTTTVLGMSTMLTSVMNLGTGIRDWSDANIAVEAAQRKVSTATEALEKAQDKLGKLVKEGVTSGKDYENAQRDVEQAQQMVSVQTQRLGERYEQLFDSQSRFVMSVIPTVLSAWGTYSSMMQQMTQNGTSFGGMLTDIGTKLGVVTKAADAGGIGMISLGKGADAAKLSMVQLAAEAAATAAIIYGVIELVNAMPKLQETFQQFQTAKSGTATPLERTQADIGRKETALGQLTSGDWKDVGAKIAGFIARLGGADPEATIKAQIKALKEYEATINEVAAATGKNANAVTDADIKNYNYAKSIGVVGTNGKNLLQYNKEQASVLRQQAESTDMSSEAWSAYDKMTQQATEANQQNRKEQILLDDALGKHIDIESVNYAMVQSIVKAQDEKVNKWKEEEGALAGVIVQNDLMNDSFSDLLLNEQDNVTQIEEMIAANLNYMKGLTDVDTHARLVADGHMKGALALQEFINTTITSVAQNEAFNAGLQAIVTTSGGLPPLIKNTTENQKLWTEAILGNTDALDSLNKIIQDSVLKSFGELNKVFSDLVKQWGSGEDAQKKLKEQLKDLLPKDIRKEVELNLDLKVNQDKLLENLKVEEAVLFDVVKNELTHTPEFAFKPDIAPKIDEKNGTKLLEMLQKNIEDAFGKDVSIKGTLGNNLDTIVQQGIDAIKGEKDPTKIKEAVLNVFNQVQGLQGQLSSDMGVLTDNVLSSFNISPQAIATARSKVGGAGTETALGYNEAFLAELQKAGVPPATIEKIKASFDPAKENAGVSGVDTANAFSTNLQTQLASSLATLDFTKTVFSTMVKAATLTAEGIVQIFATNFNKLSDAMTTGIGAVSQMFTGLVTHVTGVMQSINGEIAVGGGTFDDNLKVGIDAMAAMFAGSGGAGGGSNGLVGAVTTAMEQVNAAITTGANLFAGSLGEGMTKLTTVLGGLSDSMKVEMQEVNTEITTGADTFITSIGDAWGKLTVVLQGLSDVMKVEMEEVNTEIVTGSGNFITSIADGWQKLTTVLQGLNDVMKVEMEEVNAEMTKGAEQFIPSIKDGWDKLTVVLKGLSDTMKIEMVEVNKEVTSGADKFATSIHTGWQKLTTVIGGLSDTMKVEMTEVNKELKTGGDKFSASISNGISAMIKMFDGLPAVAKKNVEKINDELSKIKSPTVKVNYDTSGAPKAFGADFIVPRKAASGIDVTTERGVPQMILVGEGANRERVRVTREGDAGFYDDGHGNAGRSGSTNVVLNADITVVASDGSYLGNARVRRVFNNLESH